MTPAGPRTDDPSRLYRLYLWLFGGSNGVVVLYLLAAGLALASILTYMLTGEGEVSKLELSLMLSSGFILFYLTIGQMGDA